MAASTKIVLTGAAGHLGRHLARRLVDLGMAVVGLDVAEAAEAMPGVSFHRADLADRASYEQHLAGAAVVVHGASIHPWKPYRDEQYLDANIKGTWQLYAAMADAGVGRAVLTSSIAAIGYPPASECPWPVRVTDQFVLNDLYCFTKHAQEDIAKLYAGRSVKRVVTWAIRPPAFMPKDRKSAAFSLLGAYTTVEDVAAAHVAAVRALLAGNEPRTGFEALFATGPLPYDDSDRLTYAREKSVRPLVRRHFPDLYDRLIAAGFEGVWLPCTYDLAPAAERIGWTPSVNIRAALEKALAQA